MTSKHTKGTWFISGSTDLVSMPSQIKIARIDYTGNSEETKANGRMLMASPKMLEMLKENLNIFKEAKTVFDQAGLKMHADGTQLEIDKIEKFLKDFDL